MIAGVAQQSKLDRFPIALPSLLQRIKVNLHFSPTSCIYFGSLINRETKVNDLSRSGNRAEAAAAVWPSTSTPKWNKAKAQFFTRPTFFPRPLIGIGTWKKWERAETGLSLPVINISNLYNHIPTLNNSPRQPTWARNCQRRKRKSRVG